MARIKSDGLEEMARVLKGLSAAINNAQPQIMEAGAKVLVDEWKAVIQEKSHVDTGDMRDSVAATQPKEIAGGYAVEVYPQGTDRKGVRNAEKAFLLHYGWKANKKKKRKTSRQDSNGDHFVDEIESRGGARAVEAMQAELNQIVEKNT